MVSNGRSYSLSEIELTELIQMKADRERLAGESRAKAFARVFSATDDEGIALRKAIAIAKAAPFPALGEPVTPDGRQAAGSGSAYDALMAKAEQLRQRDPTLTREQSFAKVFSDPENAELAGRERLANRPVATW